MLVFNWCREELKELNSKFISRKKWKFNFRSAKLIRSLSSFSAEWNWAEGKVEFVLCEGKTIQGLKVWHFLPRLVFSWFSSTTFNPVSMTIELLHLLTSPRFRKFQRRTFHLIAPSKSSPKCRKVWIKITKLLNNL